MNITNIEKLTYEEAQKLAVGTMKIKDHDCIFAELGDSFGYSVLVFKNNHHIYYANDYQLHHNYLVKEQGKEALREYYINSLERKLYTDDELMDNISTYDEYGKKSYFLRNYWIMRYDYVSAFAIGREQQKEVEKAKRRFPFFNPISFCYVADENIIKTQGKYNAHLETAYKALKENNDTFREMIRYELANHEYGYTRDPHDALMALGMSLNKVANDDRLRHGFEKACRNQAQWYDEHN